MASTISGIGSMIGLGIRWDELLEEHYTQVLW